MVSEQRNRINAEPFTSSALVGQFYDSNTGSVTVTGLPASLSPGQTEHVLLSYTAPTPASGTVTLPVTSSITTTSTDSTTRATTSLRAIPSYRRPRLRT
mgnify:CR=1 FL=1|jgi:hypothetical protein